MEGQAGSNSSGIGSEQNLENNLRLRVACGVLYSKAKKVHFLGFTFSILLALISVIAIYFFKYIGNTLGIIGTIWILVSRIVLQPWCEKLKLSGALAQEEFDCSVLDLEWNETLPSKLSPEEVLSASLDRSTEKFQNWYPEVDAKWPQNILIAQRSNNYWSKSLNRRYRRLQIVLILAIVMTGILICSFRHEQLSTYLVAILLPSIPSLLDLSDMARSFGVTAQDHLRVEARIERQLSSLSSVSKEDLRQNQDRIFLMRCQGPLVPDSFYTFLREEFERLMQFAARQIKSISTNKTS